MTTTNTMESNSFIKEIKEIGVQSIHQQNEVIPSNHDVVSLAIMEGIESFRGNTLEITKQLEQLEKERELLHKEFKNKTKKNKSISDDDYSSSDYSSSSMSNIVVI
jgi:hypothetical protein